MRPRLLPPSAQSFTFRTSVFFLVALGALAQDTTVFTNRGEPMGVGYRCVEEDLQWAGMSCSDDPCAVYLELTAVAAQKSSILAAGNLHSASATLSSILLQSNDSGATWSERAARIRGDAIEQLQFLDSEHAWAAGETQYPLARDPFVLVTTDAGTSWREYAVGEEGNAGSVQRLWFDSPQHGELIVNGGKKSGKIQFSVFESNTGGDSWKLATTADRAPLLRNAPAAPGDPNWRISTSKDSNSYRIENRVGDDWRTVASFLVEAARCKIDPGQAVEPKP
jgi:hypothetical protein